MWHACAGHLHALDVSRRFPGRCRLDRDDIEPAQRVARQQRLTYGVDDVSSGAGPHVFDPLALAFSRDALSTAFAAHNNGQKPTIEDQGSDQMMNQLHRTAQTTGMLHDMESNPLQYTLSSLLTWGGR